MRHQSPKGFHGIFVGIPKNQKGYLEYVPSTRNIISSHDFVFNESLSSALAYTSRHYSEAMAISPTLTYTPYATSLKEQTDDVFTFAKFEEKNIITETRNDAESGDKSNSEIFMMSKQYMDAINSGDESNHDIISAEILVNIRDKSQTHPNVNRREAR